MSKHATGALTNAPAYQTKPVPLTGREAGQMIVVSGYSLAVGLYQIGQLVHEAVLEILSGMAESITLALEEASGGKMVRSQRNGNTR